MNFWDPLGNSAKLFVGKRRWLKRWLLPKTTATLFCKIPQHKLNLYVDAHDLRGPSYYVMFGGSKAFDHYERAEKAEVISALPPDGVFLDVGANIGLFSLAARIARPHARIIGFEPHPDLRRCFSHTLKENPGLKIELYPWALGDRRESAPLFIDETDSGGHSLDLAQLANNKKAPRSFSVEIVPLDELAKTLKLTRLDVVKIDVQGNEPQVLNGAKKTLAQFRPTLLMECDLDQIGKTSWDFFTQFNYQFRKVAEENWRSLSDLPALAQASLAAGVKQANLVFSPINT